MVLIRPSSPRSDCWAPPPLRAGWGASPRGRDRALGILGHGSSVLPGIRAQSNGPRRCGRAQASLLCQDTFESHAPPVRRNCGSGPLLSAIGGTASSVATLSASNATSESLARVVGRCSGSPESIWGRRSSAAAAHTRSWPNSRAVRSRGPRARRFPRADGRPGPVRPHLRSWW
jgi:hypothetical protein